MSAAGTILSRETRRPRRTCRLPLARGDLRGWCAVERHREDLPPAQAIRLERQVTPVGRPGRARGAARPERQRARGGAVGVDRPELMTGLPLRVDDRVALRRPAWLRLEAARGEPAPVVPAG